MLRILMDIADGLVELHSRHIVHLDLKPDNVLMTKGTDRSVRE